MTVENHGVTSNEDRLYNCIAWLLLVVPTTHPDAPRRPHFPTAP